MQAVVQIPEVVRYVTSRLLWGQGVGACIGGVLGLVVSITSRRKKPAPAPPSTSVRLP